MSHSCFQIEFLKDVGGATGHQSVNKMLAKIITNSVASNFNYTGKGSKKAAFGELHIWKIISGIFMPLLIKR